MQPAPAIGRRVTEFTPQYVPYPRPPAGAPNVVMIVLDDVGFAQLGCFGSAIETPGVDRLAADGLRYNRFHVTSICSSTRAALLTGRNHHAVGVGVTQETPLGFPGYTGRLPKSAATLARVLRDNGYSTCAVGKWHLAARGEYGASGPMDRWPLGLGFERFYGFLGAETSQWTPDLVRDNSFVERPARPEDGYHLSEDLADQAIRMVQDQQQAAPHKPFFCYFATGAAHAPHQVPRPWIDAYSGRFDDGWEALRRDVFARQVRDGIVPEGTTLSPRPSWVPEWGSLSADERRLYARHMEVFAGFVSHTDAQIARFLGYLEQRGVLDDTIVLLLSDNGASSEGGIAGTTNEAHAWMGVREDLGDALARIDELGGFRAFSHYPWGWAWAGNTPLQLWKRYAWLGGTRTPLVVRWPRRIVGGGEIRPQFTHAVDVFPTVLDAIGIEAPDVVDGVHQQRIDGVSFLPTMTDPETPERHLTQYFEMHGSRGIYHLGWKATTDYVSPLFGERDHLEGSQDFDTDHWALFDLTTDFAEAHDVSAEHPELARRLEQLWWAEAGRNQVLPLFEGFASLHAMHPGEFTPPAGNWYTPGGAPVVESQLPAMMGGVTITAELDGAAAPEGILATLGDRHGGWALYLLDGRPVFTVVSMGHTVRLAGADAVGPGAHTVALTFAPADGNRLTLLVDGAVVAEGVMQGMFFFPAISTAGGGMSVGRSRNFAVCDDYEGEFPCATLQRITVVSGAPAAAPDPATRARAAVRAD